MEGLLCSGQGVADRTLLKIIASIRLMEWGYAVYVPSRKIKYDLIAQKSVEFLRIRVEYLNMVYAGNTDTKAVIVPRTLRTSLANHLEFIFAVDVNKGFYAVIPAREMYNKRQLRLSENNQYWRYLNSFVALEELSFKQY